MNDLSGELWPAHPKPLPDELLSSWIVRIARAHGLKLQTFCDLVFGKQRQLWNRDIDRSAPEWLLQELSRRTGTSDEIVRGTTLRIYEGRLFHKYSSAGVLRWILPLGIYHRTRRRFGMQFCPQCLTEDQEPYFRTQWRLAILTWCPKHRILLHDRCPACAGPATFHRRELGRPAVTDSGLLSDCHLCSFDLRKAAQQGLAPCESSIDAALNEIASVVAGRPIVINSSHLDVLHQISKVMVSQRKSAKLAFHVSKAVDIPGHPVTRGRQAIELLSVTERHRIIQMSAWLLADPEQRLPAAWQSKSVRYSDLTRDFGIPLPPWYMKLTDSLNRSAARNPSKATAH